MVQNRLEFFHFSAYLYILSIKFIYMMFLRCCIGKTRENTDTLRSYSRVFYENRRSEA